MVDFALILLTYKGKVLLTFQGDNSNVLNNAIWHFIGGIKQKNKSEIETITKLVERETGIKLASVDFLSKQSLKDISEHLYWAKLTDDNVNNMDRGEGQLINFYSVAELENLCLSTSTKHFISKHSELLKNIRND